MSAPISDRCGEQSWLAAFLRGDLPEDAADRLAVHVEDCRECGRALAELESEFAPVLDLMRTAGGRVRHPCAAIELPLELSWGSSTRLAEHLRGGNAWTSEAMLNETLRHFEGQGEKRRFAKGELLVRQGSVDNSMILVCDGTVEISTEDEAGCRRVIDRSGPGELLGEMSLVTREPRTASVVALEPVRACVLPLETVDELARQHPVISIALMHLVASRLGSQERDVLAGKVLGGYLIRRRLGRGGMSVVYDATDFATGRRAALKMMSHRLAYDTEALSRFHREARLIESFDHENIVRMYGTFPAFHTWFLVMELVQGSTLKDAISARGCLPESVARSILGHLARALQYMHAAGVIHRDVKPSNVMLARDGSVKLMDFGLALPLAGALDRAEIAGTPRYMAPEQVAGDPLGREADYFALGCLAWEMLSGRALFDEATWTGHLMQRATWTPPDFAQALPEAGEDYLRLLRDALQPVPAARRLKLEELSPWAAPLDRTFTV